MRFLTRSLLALFIVALALGFLGMGAITLRQAIDQRAERAQPPRDHRERVFTARVVPIHPAEMAPLIAAYGEVRARRILELRAPISGRVEALATEVENGALVRAGQWLVRLDPADATALRNLARNDLARTEAEARDAARALDLSRADLAEAEAQAGLRRRALTRRQTLLERGVGTEAGIEEAELALAGARATIIARAQAEAQAEARLGQAETALARQRISLADAERRLADTEIFAGFDGVLADVVVVEGGNVGVNERLMRIIDPQALEVAFRLSTAQYLRLIDADGALPALPGEAALDIGGVEITTPVTVVRASATVGEGQSGRLIYAEIAAPRGFRPGDFVTVRLAEPILPDVALLPAAAVDAEGGVLLLGAEDRLEEGVVDVLRRQGDSVLVRAPAALAEREVVAARGPLLGAGIRVRPQRDGFGSSDAMAAETTPDMLFLDPERRARLIAQVQASVSMPAAARDRIMAQLQNGPVPARLIERLEQGSGAGAAGRGG